MSSLVPVPVFDPPPRADDLHARQHTPLQVRSTLWRAADILIDVLAKAGVEVIFGIPGGAIVALNDALLDRPDIRVITTRHEGGAMFAAAGYARATGKLGVVMVTSGPGVLNCMTGLASAFCDSLPLLVIAGEVPRSTFGRGALQEGSANHLNLVGMARHVTKLAREVTDANAAPAMLCRAIETATSGKPGPVLLSIPLDVTTAKIRRPGISGSTTSSSTLSAGILDKVAGALHGATRPLLLAGSGTRWGRGPERLRELAERLQAPVMTTPKAKGVFPEDHPLSLGVFGHGGHPSASEYLEEGVDVLLAVATGLTDPATNSWSDLLRPQKHLIQIDIDAMHLGRNYEVSLGLVGPAEQALEGIIAHLVQTPRAAKCFGVTTYTDPAQISYGPGGRIAPQRALWELQQWLPRNTIFTCDIGEHLMFATHYLRINDPDGFLVMSGLASMGSSMPGALGTKLGARNRTVCAVVGDGAFAMSIGDLATAAQEKLPIVVAVLNDQRYGMVELGHLAIYGRTPRYSCDELNIPELARGAGARAVVIENPDELAHVEPPSQQPLVLDIRIDREVRMPKSNRFKHLGAGAGRSWEMAVVAG